jgi:hypothetical protein
MAVWLGHIRWNIVVRGGGHTAVYNTVSKGFDVFPSTHTQAIGLLRNTTNV